MPRPNRFSFFTALALISLASRVFASTHYIAAAGSDLNDGTTTSTPWLHAPGMADCSGNCAGYSPVAGDRFIFRGGDTWHTSTGSPIGLPWTWNWSGSSSSAIYIGVDATWYAGASFTRPIFTMDNPATVASPPGCSYDDSARNGITVTGSYVTIDNFELTGKCWSGDPTGHYTVGFTGSYNKATNNYIHGWSVAAGAADDNHTMFAADGSNSEWAYNVVDGFDSTFGAICNSPMCVRSSRRLATGWAFGGATSHCYNINHNVIRHVGNGVQCATIDIVHDNLFEYTWNPSFGGRHGNTLETNGGTSGEAFYFYNNMVRNAGNSVQIWPQAAKMYIFNNVMGDTYNAGNSPPDPNCLILSPAGFRTGSAVITVYMYNNTFPSTCNVQAFGGNGATPSWAPGSSIVWQNNHIIGRTAISGGLFACRPPSSCAVTDNGGELFQNGLAAARQGYTNANSYLPASSSGATVGAALNASSLCSMFSPDNALCSGTTAGVLEVEGSGGYVASSPAVAAVPRPANGAWDAGAYSFGGSSAGRK